MSTAELFETVTTRRTGGAPESPRGGEAAAEFINQLRRLETMHPERLFAIIRQLGRLRPLAERYFATHPERRRALFRLPLEPARPECS